MASLVRKISLAFSIIILVIIFDQVLKNIAPSFLPIYCNKGIAFGVGVNGIALSAIVLGLILYLLVTTRNRIPSLALSMILGGGVSNLIDRISIGCVRDFISVGFFPRFNLADMVITCGAFLLVVASLRKTGSVGNRD